MTTVLVQHGEFVDLLTERFPDLRILDVSRDDPPPGTRAEVYFGFGDWERAMRLARESGVVWMHLSATGVNKAPPELFDAVEMVTCGRGSFSPPIAEYVLAAMLAAAKGFPGNWLHAAPEKWGFQTMDPICGRTLGIIGLGSIGERVARLALAFDMNVVALRRTDRPSSVAGVEIVTSLDDLLPRADHLVLAAPATSRTRHIIDARALSMVKPGVHLVNIARGTLVDHDALRVALDDGRVSRASLDTTEPEPAPAGHWVYDHPKVFLTPHSSWSSPQLLAPTFENFADKLRTYLAGEAVSDRVDRDEGY